MALLVPMCGAAGIWGPSCIANAQLAAQELNADRGILDRPTELMIIDSAIEAESPAEELVDLLIRTQSIDAVVGMHISAVHQRVARIARGRVPYIYTPVYEGGETTPGVYAIGDTPAFQLGPAIERLTALYRHKKWALIGNDYVWPRASNAFAKRKIAELGGEIVGERYLPFGSPLIETEVEKLSESGAEAVLMTLVGQDAVDFNRAFGHASLDRQMIRLSCVLEENCLLACGEDALKRMYSAASYFSALETEENAAFKERYFSLHGDRAPMLNSIGQSSYEGLQFLSGLLEAQRESWATNRDYGRTSAGYRSARRPVGDLRRTSPAESIAFYLARAEGVEFRIIERF
ncbi:MAG: substrate-binding domain-containing protein [Pseudomonadota bacterium]